ncbi:MAG TPA: phosphodiester glycosidase family protein [Gemmatimonadaceae bacterium]|nr:phosphodiester glycosidase family protein [Gemmatimonadaceae bacterium]
MMVVRRLALGALVVALGAPSHTRHSVSEEGGEGASALAVSAGGEWRPWWRSDSAPTRWSKPLDVVSRAVEWRAVTNGVETGELRLSGSGEAWRVRVILVRMDPKLVRFQLDSGFENGFLRAAWTVDRAPAEALVAFNAGQFSGALPWGWVVLRGREFLPPGRGPLSTAVTIDTAGVLRWSPPDSIQSLRYSRGIAAAFQSYPTLLEGDGDVPLALRPDSHITGVSLDHGDSRLAIGALRDGRVLVALTRFDGLGGLLEAIPLGLTTPQTAALMGALGCKRAVMLDGGISSQLLVRDSTGVVQRWPGIRRVPLGLVVAARESESREQGAGSRRQEAGNRKM